VIEREREKCNRHATLPKESQVILIVWDAQMHTRRWMSKGVNTQHAERIIFVPITFSRFFHIFSCWSSNSEAHTRVKKTDLRIKFSFPFVGFLLFLIRYIFIAKFLRWNESFVPYFLYFFLFLFFSNLSFSNNLYNIR
jgi:hypothetical protein